MWYEFDQNNSGGWFHINDEKGIGPKVWIEADNANEANEKAQEIGIYFNGVDKGRDCDCCGDRWDATDKDWGFEKPKFYSRYTFHWHDTVYLHNKNGTITRLKEGDDEGLFANK